MVQAYNKYKDHGIEFVSITNSPEQLVSDFVDKHDIDWPNGYGASRDQLFRYGAFNPSLGDGMAGLEVVPSMYLIDKSDGAIVWSSNSARHEHQPVDKIISELETAIESTLKVKKQTLTE